jgi:hypothetical protein
MLTTLDLWEGTVGVEGTMFLTLKVFKSLRHQDRQQLTTIAVEGTIFAFGFSKKYNLSLLPTSGRGFDR